MSSFYVARLGILLASCYFTARNIIGSMSFLQPKRVNVLSLSAAKNWLRVCSFQQPPTQWLI